VSIEPTTGEIERVLAQVQSMKRLAIGAIAVAAAALAFAVTAIARSVHVELPTGPEKLDASEITMRDEQGNVRGRWTFQGLSLADESGRMRAGLSVSDRGAPALTLFGAQGTVRAVLSLGSEDSPALTLHDEKQRVRTRVLIGADDAPSIVLTTQQGDVTGRLPAPAATPAVKARKRGR
jgi:hypothetical protein